MTNQVQSAHWRTGSDRRATAPLPTSLSNAKVPPSRSTSARIDASVTTPDEDPRHAGIERDKFADASRGRPTGIALFTGNEFQPCGHRDLDDGNRLFATEQREAGIDPVADGARDPDILHRTTGHPRHGARSPLAPVGKRQLDDIGVRAGPQDPPGDRRRHILGIEILLKPRRGRSRCAGAAPTGVILKDRRPRRRSVR